MDEIKCRYELYDICTKVLHTRYCNQNIRNKIPLNRVCFELPLQIFI